DAVADALHVIMQAGRLDYILARRCVECPPRCQPRILAGIRSAHGKTRVRAWCQRGQRRAGVGCESCYQFDCPPAVVNGAGILERLSLDDFHRGKVNYDFGVYAHFIPPLTVWPSRPKFGQCPAPLKSLEPSLRRDLAPQGIPAPFYALPRRCPQNLRAASGFLPLSGVARGTP